MTRSQTIVLGGILGTLGLLAVLGVLFLALDTGWITPSVEMPKLQLQFHTAGDQAKQDKAVHDFFAGFAQREGLTFEDTAPQPQPEDGPRTFSLDMSHGGLGSIKVRSVTQPNRFFVFVYAEKPDPALDGITARLTAQLRKTWPDTEAVKGPQ